MQQVQDPLGWHFDAFIAVHDLEGKVLVGHCVCIVAGLDSLHKVTDLGVDGRDVVAKFLGIQRK